MTMTVRHWSLLLAFLTMTLAGCDRQGTVLKKGETPNPLVARKVAPVPAQNLDKLVLLRKSTRFSVSEMVKVLGGFRYKATSRYTLKRGKKVVKLNEVYTLEQNSSGAFRAAISNEHKKGYTVVWNGKSLYWRARYRPFRKISEDAMKALRWQQRGYGRWRSIVSIFGERLDVARNGSGSQAGRSCLKYTVRLKSTAVKAPPVPKGTVWQGRLPDLTRGKAAKKKRIPTSARGSFCVTSKGMILRADFTGSYVIGKSGATMTMVLKSGMTAFGNPAVAVPAKLADIQREPVPLDPFATKKNRPFYFQPPPKERKVKKRKKR